MRLKPRHVPREYKCAVCSAATTELPVMTYDFGDCTCVAMLGPCCSAVLELHGDELVRVLMSGGHHAGCWTKLGVSP